VAEPPDEPGGSWRAREGGLRRDRLGDQLYRLLVAAVVRGDYATGSRLPPERELAARFGVTRATVKQAVVRLEEAGLVVTRHGVGSVVGDVGEAASVALLPELLALGGGDVLGDLFEARERLGREIVGLAAERRSGADVERLVEALGALGAAEEPAAVQRAEAEVHRRIARASGNAVFVLLVNTLLEAYAQVAPLVAGVFADGPRVAARLRPVVEAVAGGDAEAARAAAQRYLAWTGAAMHALLVEAGVLGRGDGTGEGERGR
jgi:GntR family transcriptional repressor for pyruvate dehydrogenase complex